jgi:Lon-like ATP-dependent protease
MLVAKEREMAKIQQEIQKKVEEKLSKTQVRAVCACGATLRVTGPQREHFLHEQLKSIKKELGLEKDDKEALVAKFTERRDAAVGMSDEAKAVINEEVGPSRVPSKRLAADSCCCCCCCCLTVRKASVFGEELA